MREILRLKRFYIGLLIIPAMILTSLAKHNPDAVERVYSLGIYPALSGFFAGITGVFPFSLAQWVVTLVPLTLIIYIVKKLIAAVRDREIRRKNIATVLATVFCAAGIIWFGFTILCGLNYYRIEFASSSGLDVRTSDAGELYALCSKLAEDANLYGAKVNRNEEGVMILAFESSYSAAKFASEAFKPSGEKYSVLAGFYPRAKPVLGSRVMSLLDLVGVYFPFTFEANVNADIPHYNIPSSMLHELAHFKGFMREDEANFISYIACVSCGNDDFAYSGTMLALLHSSNALYSTNKDAYWNVMDMLDSDIISDFRANDAYWQQFEGPVSAVSEKVNDVYLKTNNQPQGVKSYGRMVDLLLANYRQRNGL